MADNPGLDAIIQQQVGDFLSDTTNLPASFLDGMNQWLTLNQLPSAKTTTPPIDATQYGIKGDGIVDDTNAIQSSVNALVNQGSGILYIPPGDYKLTGPITVSPLSNQSIPMLISGYGAKFHLTTASAGWVFHQASTKSWRNFRVEGLQCLVDSNAATDCFLFTDNGHSGSFWNWVARDLTVETGTASAPICNGIHVTDSSGTNVLFQLLIESCNTIMSANTTGVGIFVASTGSGISSVEVRNPNTFGFSTGVQFGTSGHAITGATLIGGTVVSANQEGVKLYCHGGGLYHTHVENSFLTAPTGTQGGEIYIEGHGSIIEADVHRQTAGGHALWGIAAFASAGSVNVIGRGSDQSGFFVRIINTTGNTSGTVNIVGVPSSLVDYSQVLTDATPILNLWQPRTRTDPTFPGSGGSVAIDATAGAIHFITVTDATAFAIVNPTALAPGDTITLVIFNNTSGAMGAVTLGSAFQKTAAVTTPAAGKMRTLTFVCYTIHGTQQLIEISRAAADI